MYSQSAKLTLVDVLAQVATVKRYPWDRVTVAWLCMATACTYLVAGVPGAGTHHPHLCSS